MVRQIKKIQEYAKTGKQERQRMIEIRRETAKEVAAVRRIHEKACMIPILDRTATRGVSGTARYRKEFDEAL